MTAFFSGQLVFQSHQKEPDNEISIMDPVQKSLLQVGSGQFTGDHPPRRVLFVDVLSISQGSDYLPQSAQCGPRLGPLDDLLQWQLLPDGHHVVIQLKCRRHDEERGHNRRAEGGHPGDDF